ncbi:impB/mucB/samB family protein [Methylobacterium sp. UNCCL125]|nr:impB/mucB/samB family protein [Methylobacterium sp. UNCCL125]
MSARVNEVYERFSPRIEDYSIDESFLDLTDVRQADRMPLARDMRATVQAWTGIPNCVGIGPTKTLAKLANHVAKKVPELEGVCDLTDPVQYAHWMARIEPGEIWGSLRVRLGHLSMAVLGFVIRVAAGTRPLGMPASE